jgi:hypothetical protein
MISDFFAGGVEESGLKRGWCVTDRRNTTHPGGQTVTFWLPHFTLTTYRKYLMNSFLFLTVEKSRGTVGTIPVEKIII